MTLLDAVNPDAAVRRLADLLGAVLREAVGLLARLRPGRKPMHPDGRVRVARLVRHGVAPASGIAFLDEVGEHEVVVRESNGIGLPGGVADLHGLAVKVPLSGGAHGDLLLTSTGRGRLTRFLLTTSRRQWGRPMTTLFPFDTVLGPVLVGAREVAPDRIELDFAVGTGPWRTFAHLVLPAGPAGDEAVDFDGVTHPLPGLDQYDVVRRLRAPSYHRARASRARQRAVS